MYTTLWGATASEIDSASMNSGNAEANHDQGVAKGQ
jgi:hypothetical protein